MAECLRRLVPAVTLPLCPLVARAQEQEGAAPTHPSEFSKPIPLYQKGLGDFRWRISTQSAQAPAYFNGVGTLSE